MQFFRKRLNKKGFTLIELIVVIAILGILALIAIPRLAGFTENAKQANDKEMAAVIANAAAMYYASNPTDTSITLAELQGADLLVTGDETPESDGFSAGVVFPIVVSGGTVTVTLTGDAPPASYVITK